MFTGIVREVGKLAEVVQLGESARLRISAPMTAPESNLGDSICVNGVCLTVAALDEECFWADLSCETLTRTTFANAKAGALLNIEPSLRPTDKMGGHIVAGHVDAVGAIESLSVEGRLWFRFPNRLAPYIAEKGSICIEGISLTVTEAGEDRAGAALIPHTIQNTNLRAKKPGDPINIEIDILARYIQRLLSMGAVELGSGLTAEKLRQYGF
ncbi:MAG: riboflavin synthase [Candidatus Omnitrophota bacterium]